MSRNVLQVIKNLKSFFYDFWMYELLQLLAFARYKHAEKVKDKYLYCKVLESTGMAYYGQRNCISDTIIPR